MLPLQEQDLQKTVKEKEKRKKLKEAAAAAAAKPTNTIAFADSSGAAKGTTEGSGQVKSEVMAALAQEILR